MPNYNQSHSSLSSIDNYLTVVQYVRDQPFWPSIILKIRYPKFSVYKQFFRGRRLAGERVCCEVTPVQIQYQVLHHLHHTLLRPTEQSQRQGSFIQSLQIQNQR